MVEEFLNLLEEKQQLAETDDDEEEEGAPGPGGHGSPDTAAAGADEESSEDGEHDEDEEGEGETDEGEEDEEESEAEEPEPLQRLPLLATTASWAPLWWARKRRGRGCASRCSSGCACWGSSPPARRSSTACTPACPRSPPTPFTRARCRTALAWVSGTWWVCTSLGSTLTSP